MVSIAFQFCYFSWQSLSCSLDFVSNMVKFQKFGIICLFFSFLGTFELLAQIQIPELQEKTPIKLRFSQRGQDAEQLQSMSLSPLFYLYGDRVAEFLDLSSVMVGDSVRHQKIVPPNQKTQNMAYGYFFEKHNANTFSPNHTLFIVENAIQLHRGKSLIWIDRNHNFNFTDDIPDTLFQGSSLKPIATGNNPKSLGIQFEPFPHQQFKQFAKMSDDAILTLQGDRTYVSTRFSLKETRWNLWYASVIFDEDTLNIAIKDVNCNGKYNDKGIDKIYLKPQGADLFQASNALTISDNNYLFWMGNTFLISEIDASLEFVNMIKVKSQENESSLAVGQKIPRFRFCVAEKPVHKKQIRRVKSDFLFIYVWSAENPTFIQDSAIMHQIQRTLPSNFKILMLNHGGSGKYVYRYNKRYEINFFHGFCSPQIAKRLKLQSMPQSFLLDSRHRIIKIGMNPRQFQRFIAKNTLSK